MAALSLDKEQQKDLADSLKELLDVYIAVDKAKSTDSAKGESVTIGEVAKIVGEAFDLRGQFKHFSLGADFMDTPDDVIVGMLVDSGLVEEKWRRTYIAALGTIKGGIRTVQEYQYAKAYS